MKEEKVLNTITDVTRESNSIKIFTYFVTCKNYIKAFISEKFYNFGGVEIEEGDLIFQKQGFDDIEYFLNEKGELIIKADSTKDFSINENGELIMVDNNSIC